MTALQLGDKVEKTGGDYSFEGTVICVCEKLSGAIRYVVENPAGILHIYSEKNLTLKAEDSYNRIAT